MPEHGREKTGGPGPADAVVLFIAQGAYSGRIPVAPGTAGTLAGVLLYYLGIKDLSTAAYGAACAAIFLGGILAAGRAEELLGRTDHPSIVIDEIAGFLLSLLLVPASWYSVAAAFVLFRIFDIVKPWPLKRLQDLHGGTGVMLDDIGAAVYTNVILQIAWYLVGR